MQAALRQVPNVITVARLVLVVPTAWTLWHGAYTTALWLLAVAGASDAVDGWLARRLDARSRFGAALDPVADKLLVGVLFVTLTVQGHLPIWLVAIVVGRDVIVLVGAGIYRLLFQQIELVPTFISKVNTAAQIIVLLLILLMLCELPFVSALAAWVLFPTGVHVSEESPVLWLVAILGVVSGLDYVVTWGRRALLHARTR